MFRNELYENHSSTTVNAFKTTVSPFQYRLGVYWTVNRADWFNVNHGWTVAQGYRRYILLREIRNFISKTNSKKLPTTVKKKLCKRNSSLFKLQKKNLVNCVIIVLFCWSILQYRTASEGVERKSKWKNVLETEYRCTKCLETKYEKTRSSPACVHSPSLLLPLIFLSAVFCTLDIVFSAVLPRVANRYWRWKHWNKSKKIKNTETLSRARYHAFAVGRVYYTFEILFCRQVDQRRETSLTTVQARIVSGHDALL